MSKKHWYRPAPIPPPTRESIQIVSGMSTKEWADVLAHNWHLGHEDYDNFGGLLSLRDRDITTLFQRIRELEAEVKQLSEGKST